MINVMVSDEGIAHRIDVEEPKRGSERANENQNAGDCTAADLSSAGAHFNPTNKPHAGPDDMQRHVGDKGNIEADASGAGKLDYVDHNISLVREQSSVIGRSVVVHAKADDLKTQPAGDSGARVACGVIGIAKSK